MKMEKKEEKAKQLKTIILVAVIAAVMILGAVAYNSFSGGSLATTIVASKKKCADGTALNACSRTKPDRCMNVNKVPTLKANCKACGCQSGFRCDANTGKCVANQVTPTLCGDGTALNACSQTKPNQCVNVNSVATLKPNCSACGCPSGSTCNKATGSCSAAEPTQCSDGTPMYACSASKPYRCINSMGTATFMKDCKSCGCPTGSTCQYDSITRTDTCK